MWHNVERLTETRIHIANMASCCAIVVGVTYVNKITL